MSFDAEAAKRAGYSDAEIQSFLQKQQTPKTFDAQAAKEAGYSDKEISDFLNKNKISKTRSVISAPIKGILKGAEELSQFSNPLNPILQQIAPQKTSLLQNTVEDVLPTKDEAAEQYLERAGNLLPTVALGGEGVVMPILQAASGALLGTLAKEEGVGDLGQGISEAIGIGLPGLMKAASKTVSSFLKSPVEKLPSGLTKPRAIDAKLSKRAILTPKTQESAIAKLNDEASKLGQSVIEKEVPLAKQIQEGMDFESQFEKGFGQIQKMAESANPEIDITPLSQFFSESAAKYRGIPKLHPEAAKISTEIKAFRKNTPIELKKLLRVYRSNGKKIKNIYETSRLTGKQQEYVDFLIDYNRNIAKSFEKTLPEDSAWLNQFKDENKRYKQYKDAQKTLQLVSPILEQRATPSSITKFAEDKVLQKKLQMAMGENGSSQIVQIARDVKQASTAIKNIPVKELSLWDKILPLSVFVPYGHIPGGVVTAKKSLDWLRRGYGWFLSTPARRAAYNEALKAIIDGNRSSYIKAAQELQRLSSEDSED